MGDFGKAIRLRRILRPDGGTLVIAFDHALILGPIAGTADPGRQIHRFVEAKPDAVLVNLGNFHYFAEAACSAGLPALVARLDWTTAFNEEAKTNPRGFQTCLVAHAEDALRAGADAAITFLVIGSGDAEFERKEIERVGALARDCERVGLPLLVESLARGAGVQNPRELKWLNLHTRIAAELGADAIKTENANDAASLREMIRACPVPVLVLGGSRSGSDDEVVSTVRGIMDAGAAGVFFGRNIFQSDDMPGLIQRVRSVLAGKASAKGH